MPSKSATAAALRVRPTPTCRAASSVSTSIAPTPSTTSASALRPSASVATLASVRASERASTLLRLCDTVSSDACGVDFIGLIWAVQFNTIVCGQMSFDEAHTTARWRARSFAFVPHPQCRTLFQAKVTSWSVRNPLGLALPIGIVELNRFVGTYAVTRISVNARRFTCSSCAGQEVLALARLFSLCCQ